MAIVAVFTLGAMVGVLVVIATIKSIITAGRVVWKHAVFLLMLIGFVIATWLTSVAKANNIATYTRGEISAPRW